MADKKKSEKKSKMASKLAIIDLNDFKVNEAYPIDGLSTNSYRTVEKLCALLVLRAQLPGSTQLANQTLIDLFEYKETPKTGARDKSKVQLNKDFLIPSNIDCSMFNFCYRREQVPGCLAASDLDTNSGEVFDSATERCACRVGQHGKEDSCIKSIFYHLRNAFAHGRVSLKESDSGLYLFAEDGNVPKEVEWGAAKPDKPFEINFRILIKVSTVLNWYQLLLDKSDAEQN